MEGCFDPYFIIVLRFNEWKTLKISVRTARCCVKCTLQFKNRFCQSTLLNALFGHEHKSSGLSLRLRTNLHLLCVPKRIAFMSGDIVGNNYVRNSWFLCSNQVTGRYLYGVDSLCVDGERVGWGRVVNGNWFLGLFDYSGTVFILLGFVSNM